MPPQGPAPPMRAPTWALLAASAAGILGLAWAAEALEPPLVALADLGLHEGEAVAVEAVVARAHRAGSGAQVLQLADGTGRATAFWPDAAPLEGAWVRAEGSVQRDRGHWELLARRVEVLAPPGAPWSAAQAARLAPALEGRSVAVLGTLAWPADGEPALAEGAARLPLDASPAALRGLAGERVEAQGVVRYDAPLARFLLQAWEVRPA
jgi:hypothetical protein